MSEPVSIGHLAQLNPYAQWGRRTLGNRIWGVTRDSEDNGFSSKSCLSPGIRVVDNPAELEAVLEDEPDPTAEHLLQAIGVTEVKEPARKRPRPDTPAGFLKALDLDRLITGWARDDRREQRRQRRSARVRLSCRRRRYRRCLKRRVSQLERWYTGLLSLPEPLQEHYHRCWKALDEELRNPELPMSGRVTGSLLDRLGSINPDLPYSWVSQGWRSVASESNQPQLPDKKPASSRRKHRRKHSRNSKHARTKLQTFKGVPVPVR